jgi:hypothetical protein
MMNFVEALGESSDMEFVNQCLYKTEKMKELLVGKKLEAIYLRTGLEPRAWDENGEVVYSDATGKQLLLKVDGGYIGIYAASDCCDESFFHDIVGVMNCLGKEILDISLKDLPNSYLEELNKEWNKDGNREYFEEHVYCLGFQIKTTGGYLDVLFRNHSNGCYGGQLQVCEEVMTEEPNTKNFRRILDDIG